MGLSYEENQYVIKALLSRFEDRFAILRHEMIGEFKWPIKNLPDDVKAGDTVTIKIASPLVEKDEKYQHMRQLLEELIN